MNKILLGVGIGMDVIAIIYFVDFEIGNNQEFLEITDYEIIQEKGRSLFLLATIFEKIPEKSEMSNYGFGWFNESSGKLNGYTTNIHSDSK